MKLRSLLMIAVSHALMNIHPAIQAQTNFQTSGGAIPLRDPGNILAISAQWWIKNINGDLAFYRQEKSDQICQTPPECPAQAPIPVFKILKSNGRIVTMRGIEFADGTLQSTAQLVGPKGDDGTPGMQGERGPQGPAGKDGRSTPTSTYCIVAPTAIFGHGSV